MMEVVLKNFELGLRSMHEEIRRLDQEDDTDRMC